MMKSAVLLQTIHCRAMVVSPTTEANNNKKQVLDDIDQWDQWPLYLVSGNPRQIMARSKPNSIAIIGKPLESATISVIIFIFHICESRLIFLLQQHPPATINFRNHC